MSESLILPLAAAFILGSALISWFVGRRLKQNWPRPLKVLIAGLLPTVTTIVFIGIWHYVELENYRESGSQDGFMGPLVILVYGFPIFLLMLIADLIAAAIASKRS
jgi:hypothetical protein